MRAPRWLLRQRAVLAAAALLATSTAVVLTGTHGTGHLVPSLAGALVIAGIAPLWRRRRPVAALALATGALLAAEASGGRLYNSSAVMLPLLVLTYSAGRFARSNAKLAAGFGVAAVALPLNALIVPPASTLLGDAAFDAVIVTALPMLAGWLVRRRTELVNDLRAQRAALQRERDHRVQGAAAAERVRIARELHDVIVHDVAAMVVQATAARHLVVAEPGEATRVIAGIEGSGRAALNDLRRVLGVLRSADSGLALEPQPTLERLPALVARAGGVLDVGPQVERVPVDLQLTAYRIVEDVLRDAGVVRIVCEGGDLVVEVGNDLPSTVDLTSVRQRVTLFGGEVLTWSAKPHTRLRVRLPLPVGVA